MLAWLLLLAFAADPSARMDEVVRDHVAKRQFMGSVLVARGGEIVFHRAYGSANLEWDVPNTTGGKFRIGSLSKQFTAAAILLLEQRGRLKTGDRISKYLPDSPAAWKDITFHHLLTHTSGIPNLTSFPEFPAMITLPTSPEKLWLKFRDKPLDFAPGERMSYSNSGYVLLGYLLERIAGTKYDDFLKQAIFDPLGMKDTGGDSHTRLIRHRAGGYTPEGQIIRNADYLDMTIPIGGGSLYSTTADLLRWTQGLFGGKVLSPESLKKMTTPFRSGYAYGLSVRSVDGRKSIEHAGGIQGYNSFLAYYPESKVTVAALSNLNGPGAGAIGRRLGPIAHE